MSENATMVPSTRLDGLADRYLTLDNEEVEQPREKAKANVPPSQDRHLSTLYYPLSDSRREIRMLNLSKSGKSNLLGTLSPVSLFDPGSYTALSYCWGDFTPKRSMTINSIRVDITDNLSDALMRLTSLNVTRVWVDALCINQEDHEE